MNNEFEAFIMRPGDTFIAEECGCSFTVESGPNHDSMVRQAPVCCCGHTMRKEMHGVPMDERNSQGNITNQVEYTDADRSPTGTHIGR